MSTQERAIEKAVGIYERCHRSFQTMAQHVNDTIRDRCDPALLHTIEYRAKTTESFRRKAQKSENGVPKYPDPLNQLTDLSAVRVIVFTRNAVNDICDVVASMYNIVEKEDVGERVYKERRFGYQSIHIVVELDRKLYIGLEPKIKKALCEIQVRTVLQHAWAEMEHDIQYKGSNIPAELAKRFSALAGLLEIADGEFQRIQQDSSKLKSAVQSKLLDDLTQQGFNPDSAPNLPIYSVRNVRQLVSEGRYSEALEWYNDKINNEPNNHTVKIGRAKVWFLIGDSSKALEDLAAAEAIIPSDPVIARTRKLVEEGDADSLRAQGAGGYDPGLLQSALNSLRRGDGIQAFDEFTTLEAQGYNKALSLFGKSLACTIEGDVLGAWDFIATLKIIPGTPMSVNICALQYVLRLLEGKPADEILGEIKHMMSLVPDFTLPQSHIDLLLSGMRERGVSLIDEIASNLNFLRKA
ncbi:MAG: hypothetical protein WDN44_08105 [Sphingomonas sp.]